MTVVAYVILNAVVSSVGTYEQVDKIYHRKLNVRISIVTHQVLQPSVALKVSPGL